MRKISRRFIADHRSNGDCYLIFGSGQDTIDDELKIISAYDILDSNQISNSNSSTNIIGDNFTNSDSYGLSPYNTTLTITYVVSNGEEENVKPNNVTVIDKLNVNLPNNVSSEISNSFEVNNLTSISGAGSKNNIEQIRQNSARAYSSQNRCVTDQDFMIRCKLMPVRYGSIEKVYVEKDEGFQQYVQRNLESPPSNTLNLYVLSKGKNGYSEQCNTVTKNNLRTYINQFRMAGVGIRIVDPYIVNFAVTFDYVVRKNYVKEEVLNKLFKVVKNYFLVNK